VLKLSTGDVDGYGGALGWSIVTVLGVLTIPLIWTRRAQSIGIIAFLVLFAWLMFSFGYGGLRASEFYANGSPTLVDDLRPHVLWVRGDPQRFLGSWLSVGALLIALLAFGLILVIAPPRRGDTTSLPAPRLKRVPGAGWLTLGLAVFLLGLLEMGWAAVNCTATPLIVGQCNGLSFSSVLHYGIATHTDSFDPAAALYAIPALLVGGAALALVGVWWWRRLTPGLCLWITLYLAVATFFFFVAYAGVGAIVEDATSLGLQAGHWTGQIGIVIAGAGLLIGWGAAVALWVRALRPGTAPEVAPSRP
jgi:hypothetical protein